jgi:hypothetical protein
MVPMLLLFKRLDNEAVALDTAMVFRCREAIPSFEPNATTSVHYDAHPENPQYSTLLSKMTLQQVLDVIGDALPMVHFTAPNGMTVYLDASKVKSITPADAGGEHEARSKTVIYLHGQQQQVRETVFEATQIVKSALERRVGPSA